MGIDKFGFCLMLMPLMAMAETNRITLDRGEQDRVSLTVYNDNFAIMRDSRTLVLPTGTYHLDFRGVARDIEPSTVSVTSSKDGLRIIEQNYQFDLLNKSSLLQRFIGMKLKYSRSFLQNSTYEKVLREGTLLSVDPEVVQFGDEVEIEPEGTISLPYLPSDLSTMPSLRWLLENKLEGSQTLTATYLTRNINWQADHVGTLSPDETSMMIYTWVTIENHSGTDYHNAALKLIAGSVNRAPVQKMQAQNLRQAFDIAESAPAREDFFEYHLYDIPGRTSLRNNHQKQLKLMEPTALAVQKRYVLRTEPIRYQMPEPVSGRFDVVLSFTNKVMEPLPAGTIRVYAEDQRGLVHLVGEDRLAHLPVDGAASITLGKAFDLTADRRQSLFRKVSDRSVDVSYEVEVHNHKDEPVVVEVEEKLHGSWRLLSESHESDQPDSTTLRFALPLEAGQKQTIAYAVRMEW
ncbi:MAG: hypothetical protein O2780_07030 [Proteobacteria bacterium]|jgi:hypothetical protein|nr:hypothetical protein [Pseudomonadota bacterium]MDA1299767.1 hypothetical protein [Pseudomonadota bacterium]